MAGSNFQQEDGLWLLGEVRAIHFQGLDVSNGWKVWLRDHVIIVHEKPRALEMGQSYKLSNPAPQ